MTAESGQSWPMPPPDGYTVDDLLTLPGLPPHTELIDGGLVLVSPQRYFHLAMIRLLEAGLLRTMPEHLWVVSEMTVVIDRRNGPEPDISVVRADALTSVDQTSFRAADVVLAVEVVSPESEGRDRETKPQKYAKAGIPHFWRVERVGDEGRPVVHVYVLDEQTGAYAHAGLHQDRLKVSLPYEVDIDLAVPLPPGLSGPR
ncbi:Uma2 family endonuclease [Streptomyces sp. NPDC058953]|uniref:Uma2 family endonuclease n=1 Tax=unclassified Streptomyces TaxID=2593676 RepID=UPI0036A4BF0C